MELIICTVAVAPLRKEPNHRSEMVSQVLFGELAEILETKDEWLHIRLLNDNYEGWLTEHLVEAYKAPQVKNEPVYTASALTNTININHSVIHAPMGASLTGFNESSKYLWDEKYSYKGEFKKTADPFNLEQLLQSMKLWINAPYLWGGKTYMGVDCSGFVQVVFKVQGVQLKRDAYMQAELGTLVGNLKDTKPGDLAFFHNANGRIIHVGVLLDHQQIIHASGKLRIDKIDDQGIINTESGKRTHQLNTIRRIIELPS